MNMSFGKYEGKHVGWVLIEDIDYFRWLQSQAEGHKREEYQYLLHLVEILDNKPFIETCRRCGKIATCFTIYQGSSDPYFFCDDCDPYYHHARRGTLSMGSTVSDAINLSRDPNVAIRALAMAKGAPLRKTKNTLNKFFK